MAEYMPDGYEPPRRPASGGGGGGELYAAIQLARQRPGVWVKVHEPRALTKSPTSWCSEVNLGQKVSLQGAGERWEASYEDYLGTDGLQYYTKLIRLMPAQ